MDGKKSMSLAQKMTAMVVIAIIVSAIPIGIFTYNVYRRDSIGKSQSNALAVAQSLSLAIDAEEFLWTMENFNTEGFEKNEYYLRLQRRFDRVRAEVGALFLFAGIFDANIGFINFMEADRAVLELGGIFPVEAFPPETNLIVHGGDMRH